MITFKRSVIFIIITVFFIWVTIPISNAQGPKAIFRSELCEISSAEIHDSTAYVPLEDALSLISLDYSVEYKNPLDNISANFFLQHNEQTIEVKISDGNNYMTLNEEYFYLGKKCYSVRGTLFVPLRKFLTAFDAYIVWDSATHSAIVMKSNLSPEDDLSVLTNENSNVYWLSRIISAESRGEPFEGQIAVGNVILARVASTNYPNSIYEVIFDNVPCIQFTPVENKTIYETPAPSCIAAAKLCLSGYTIGGVENCLFFQNPLTTRSGWVSENRVFAMQIGAHAFYY